MTTLKTIWNLICSIDAGISKFIETLVLGKKDNDN